MEKFLMDSPRYRARVAGWRWVFTVDLVPPVARRQLNTKETSYLTGHCSGYLTVYSMQPGAKQPSAQGRRGGEGNTCLRTLPIPPGPAEPEMPYEAKEKPARSR